MTSTASESWWGPPEPLETTPLPATAEVVVVGGGILGVATTYWLACAGAKPLLVEREYLGAGASGRNGGFLPIGTAEDYGATVARLGRERAAELLAFTRENRRLVEHVIEMEEIRCDFRPAGRLHLSLSATEIAANHRLARLLSSDGSPVECLNRAQVQERIGTPLGAAIEGGLLFREIALLHPAKLVRGLANAAAKRGGRFARAMVRAVSGNSAGAAIATDAGSIRTGVVTMAVNAWTGELVPELGSLVTPVRGQALAYAPVPPVFRTGMTALTTPTEEYWQQCVDGSIIIGGCRTQARDRDSGILSTLTTPEVQAALGTVLPRLFPRIGPLTVTHRWAGPMAFTPDRLPIVAPLPEGTGWMAAGLSGQGMSLAMILGQQLAALALHRATDCRLAFFSPDRFTGSAA
jgi:gamma-glutamylputrescine oxidase